MGFPMVFYLPQLLIFVAGLDKWSLDKHQNFLSKHGRTVGWH